MSPRTEARDRQVSAAPDVLVREIGGESVLLDLRSESYFGLDEVGTAMWRSLVETRSVGAAARALRGRWQVTPERLRRDLDALVDALAEHALVVVDPA